MIARIDKVLVIFLLLLAGGITVVAQNHHASAGAAVSQVSSEKLVQFIRERFNVPQTVSMTADPLHASSFAGFYQSTVSTDDGKQKRSSPVYLTKDGRYLAVVISGKDYLGLTEDLRLSVMCVKPQSSRPQRI